MGMDIYGKQPPGTPGHYYRASVWGWHPLADYVAHVAPKALIDACPCWHTNDGKGLDAAGSRELAAILKKSIKAGYAARYVRDRQAKLDAMPNEPCQFCGATGVRTDPVGQQMKQPATVCPQKAGHPRSGQTGWCNGCDGRASIRPHETHYTLSVERIAEFEEFLRECGGFEIW